MQTVEVSPNKSVILAVSAAKQDRYTCICCRVKFDSVELQRSHFKTEWHLYNLKRKVCTLEPIDFDTFNQIHATQIDSETQDDSSDHEASFVDLGDEDFEDTSSGDSQTLDDNEWIKIEDDECDDFLDEDYNEEEIEDLLKKTIKSDTCLFCDKSSLTIQKNINHMNTIHGFFIPEEQYLIDLTGLINYLGFKVGAGSTCLWCNKQFTSVHGVRLHMIYKDHCKIKYDQDVAIAEFKEFYDYSNQEQNEMKPVNELVLTRARRSQYGSGGCSKYRAKFIRQQIVVAQAANSANLSELYHTKKHIKRFNSDKAKAFLKVGLINNSSLRGRYKHQNPI